MGQSLPQICTNNPGGHQLHKDSRQLHSSPSVFTSADRPLLGTSLRLGTLGAELWRGIGFSLSLWLAEPETLGDAGKSMFSELGVGSVGK